MPLFIVSVVLQVALVIHIVRTGRSTNWIWIVVTLPIAGSIAYLILEVLPGMRRGRSGKKAARLLSKTVNPDRDIKRAARDYARSDTVENSIRLAQELLDKGAFKEAGQLYEKCLTGMHLHDPYIMQGLAKAEFGLENYPRVKSLLDELIAHNPDFKDADTHLLYARALEAMAESESALQEYAVLHQYYPGPEASYRHALLMKNLGRADKSRELLEEIVRYAELSPQHYRNTHREWIKNAKDALDS